MQLHRTVVTREVNHIRGLQQLSGLIRLEQWARVVVSLSSSSAYVDTVMRAVEGVTAARAAEVQSMKLEAFAALRKEGKTGIAALKVRGAGVCGACVAGIRLLSAGTNPDSSSQRLEHHPTMAPG